MSSNELVLIVDDEEMVRLALEMVLNSEGYATISACDGEEAIAIMGQRDISLVITDMKMPKADGMEVLRAAKCKAHPPKVIMITGLNTEEQAVAISEGADEFLYKAFKRADIVRAVKKVLPRRTKPAEPPG